MCRGCARGSDRGAFALSEPQSRIGCRVASDGGRAGSGRLSADGQQAVDYVGRSRGRHRGVGAHRRWQNRQAQPSRWSVGVHRRRRRTRACRRTARTQARTERFDDGAAAFWTAALCPNRRGGNEGDGLKCDGRSRRRTDWHRQPNGRRRTDSFIRGEKLAPKSANSLARRLPIFRRLATCSPTLRPNLDVARLLADARGVSERTKAAVFAKSGDGQAVRIGSSGRICDMALQVHGGYGYTKNSRSSATCATPASSEFTREPARFSGW